MSQDASLPGRLSIFQRSMLEWNSMHPYNAVHVLRIPGVLDTEKMSRIIGGVFQARGLTGLILKKTGRAYGPAGASALPEVKSLALADDFHGSISTEIENQLNSPFRMDGVSSPFRFFIGSSRDFSAFGVAYLHAVADAESVLLLMQELVETYMGWRSPKFETRNSKFERSEIETGACRGFGNLLRSYPNTFASKLASLPASLRDMKRSCRPQYRDPTNLRNGFALFVLKTEGLRRLVRAAKSWGVTVNDILLAILMKSITPFTTYRQQPGRKNKISLGCIVNARKDLASEHRNDFGLCLGLFVITHTIPKQIPLEEMAQTIGRKTLEIKGKKLYLAAPIDLSISRFLLSFLREARKREFYPKHYPLWGGLTNMNVNPLWPMVGSGNIDYFRGVCTGPATPLVVSFTTAGETANVGISYRETVFSKPDIDTLANCFLDTANNLEVRV